MNFNLTISKVIKSKVKVVLFEVSLMNFFFGYPRDRMEGESGVTRNIIDEVISSHIQEDQMEGGSGVTGSIIDEFNS